MLGADEFSFGTALLLAEADYSYDQEGRMPGTIKPPCRG